MPADPTLTALLKRARQATRDKALYFAFVMKGGAEGLLVLSKKKVTPAAIKAAKVKCGGTAVQSGRCFGEDGQVVFETVKLPPAPMAKVLKKVIKRDTELTIKAVARLAPEGEASPPDDPATAYAVRRDALRERARTAPMELQNKLTLGLNLAEQRAAQGAFEDVEQIFDKLDALLDNQGTVPKELAPQGGPAGLRAWTGKLARAPRPSAPPKRKVTARLLGSTADKPAPPDPEDAPKHVASFLPAFLVAVETERPTASQPLAVGQPVSGPDLMLGIGDLYAAVQRSLNEWTSLLDNAERASAKLDQLEKQAEKRDERVYTATLTAYDTFRTESIAAEARARQLTVKLQSLFNSLSRSQQEAALEEVRHG